MGRPPDSSYWGAAEPKRCSEGLLGSRPPIACDYDENRSDYALAKAEEEAYSHDPSEIETQS